MKKAVIFGAGSKTRLSIDEIKQKYEIVGLVDNDQSLWGNLIEDYKISSPEIINEMEFDVVVLCNMIAPVTLAWLDQLSELGISKDKICFDYCVYITDAREIFLECFAKMIYERKMRGCVAEAGVYKGDFSKVINRCFPDRKLFLFDTFEGFKEENIKSEEKDMESLIGRFGDTTEEIVMGKMTYPSNVVIKKGLFPQSAGDIEEKFVFVNLDMDLKQPTVEGLDYFLNRMTQGGIILIHDYFSKFYSGVKDGVDGWLRTHPKLQALPIGDNMSVTIIGF